MSSDERWVARPAAARAVTFLAFVIPVIAGAVAGWLTTDAMRADSPAIVVGLAAIVVTLVTVGIFQILTRRLLPLASLLHLELPFPGKRPSRFSVALKAGSTRGLAQLIEDEPASDAADAAVTILAFATALSRHDRATRGHSERVRALVDLLGTELGLADDERDRLRWAALLHDVGKLGVDHDVLNKIEPLDDADWEALRQHPLEGARLAAPLRAFLGAWADTVEHHHERWDGGGYPHGLSGDAIAYGARIVAVADTYEVMTSPVRNYRTPISATDAQRELARVAGSQLDPKVVAAFLRVDQKHLRTAMNVAALALQLPNLLRWRTPLRLGTPTPVDPLDAMDPGAPPRQEPGMHRRHPDAGLSDLSRAHRDAGDTNGADSDVSDAAATDDL